MMLLFWFFFIGGIFSYLVYPFLVWLMARRRPVPDRSGQQPPFVSLVVAAHNEEGRIGNKLENSLEIDYPADRLEILVASDGSTDRTDAIVREFADRGVRLVATGERKGKEHAQLCAIRESRGEIVVFSDVATTIPGDAFRHLVAEFDDPGVGAVSSEDRFQSDGKPAGEGIYVRYEMWLRGLESRAAGLVGMSGSFFAARREVCEPWDVGSPSDFSVALNCARQGLRAVSSPEVLGYYPNIKDERLEFPRKVRTILRGMNGLSRNLDVLNPFRYGWFSFQVFSHKLMRWAVPWFLAGLLLVTAVLAPGRPLMMLFLLAQVGFYAVAALGARYEFFRSGLLLKIPYFFTVVNLATVYATVRFLKGERLLYWQPSRR